MTTVRVKICGITSKNDLMTVINAGVDAIGFVVAVPSSPRNLTLNEAEKLVNLVPVFIDSVVVTVPESIDDLKTICEQLKPNCIQVCGEKILEAWSIRNVFAHVHLIKTVQSGLVDMSRSLRTLQLFDAVLLDTYSREKYGGTGIIHDWNLSRLIRDKLDPTPLILAGGLTPNNVKEAIQIVQPYAVDVSSGVEFSVGIKDPSKVIDFVKNSKKVRF